MAETLNTLKNRRSCRSYQPELIEEEKLDQIIEAGTYAATGMGKQSPIILSVTDRALRDKLSKMNAAVMGVDMDPFYGAPQLLIVLANKAVPTYLYDGSLVMGNLMNAAYDLGVGSCWIHRAKEEFESEEGKAILKELGIEGDYEGIGHLVLGYPAEPAKDPAPRKEGYVYKVYSRKEVRQAEAAREKSIRGRTPYQYDGRGAPSPLPSLPLLSFFSCPHLRRWYSEGAARRTGQRRR